MFEQGRVLRGLASLTIASIDRRSGWNNQSLPLPSLILCRIARSIRPPNGRVDVPEIDSSHEIPRSHVDEQASENFVGKAAGNDPDTFHIDNDGRSFTQQILDLAPNPHSALTGAQFAGRFLLHMEHEITRVSLEMPLNVIVWRIMSFTLEAEGVAQQVSITEIDSASH